MCVVMVNIYITQHTHTDTHSHRKRGVNNPQPPHRCFPFVRDTVPFLKRAPNLGSLLSVSSLLFAMSTRDTGYSLKYEIWIRDVGIPGVKDLLFFLLLLSQSVSVIYRFFVVRKPAPKVSGLRPPPPRITCVSPNYGWTPEAQAMRREI